jgi:hypothetical protein
MTPTLQIAAEEISKALERDLALRHIKTGSEPIPENELRAMARRAIFRIISQQLPDQPRRLRREMARVYEDERWQMHKSVQHGQS